MYTEDVRGSSSRKKICVHQTHQNDMREMSESSAFSPFFFQFSRREKTLWDSEEVGFWLEKKKKKKKKKPEVGISISRLWGPHVCTTSHKSLSGGQRGHHLLQITTQSSSSKKKKFPPINCYQSISTFIVSIGNRHFLGVVWLIRCKFSMTIEFAEYISFVFIFPARIFQSSLLWTEYIIL